MARPTLSVVLCVYNGAPFLDAAVESVCGQTFGDFEFIIIDDGSTDGSANLLEAWAKRDSRIRLIRYEHNIGLTPSLNEGLRRARGAFIARQDADDLSFPHRFEIQLDYLRRQRSIGLVGTDYVRRTEPTGDERVVRALRPAEAIRRHLLTVGNCIIHGSVMARREVIETVGPYDERMPVSQDYEWFLRVADRFGIDNLDVCLYLYRLVASSVSHEHRLAQEVYADWARETRLTVPFEQYQQAWQRQRAEAAAKRARWQRAKLLGQEAQYFEESDNAARAARLYEEAHRLVPQDLRLLYRLGSAAQSAELHEQALDHFESLRRRVGDTSPLHPGIHFHLGEIRLALGQLKHAAREFAECLTLEPNHRLAAQRLEALEAAL